jgi:subtilisin family serine protease
LLLLVCSSGVVQCSEKREEDKNNNKSGKIRGGSAKQVEAENRGGFTNFKPLAFETDLSAHIPHKPKNSNQNNEAATTPRIHSELKRIHEENVKNAAENVKKRRLNLQKKVYTQKSNHKCIRQNRRQLLVTCSEGAEFDCLDELVQAGVEIIHMIPETIYFSICVDTIEEAELVASMADVDGVEEDPIRTLSYLPGSQKRRNLAQQETPYGIDMVKAPEFWSAYGKQGEGVTVCVIDTGLLSLHEDIKDGDLNGSYDNDLVTPWFEDGNSHGTHVTGTIAAVDNNRGVVGVAPKVKIYVARGKISRWIEYTVAA